MRVLFTTIAATGHFYPLVPYAQEMQRRGHEVQVATPEKMAPQIAAAGLTHLPVGGPSEEERNGFFAQLSHLPPPERAASVSRDFFARLLPRKALPLLGEFVDQWRPNLIVREAGEYGAVIAAALSNTPHVRVSVSNGHTFANTIEPIDALRREFGLAPDQGAQLRSARAFSAFPASMEPRNGDGAILPQFRVSTVVAAPSSDKPEWVTSDDRPRIYLTFGTVMGSSPEAKRVFRAALDAVGGSDVSALMTTGPSMDVSALGTIPANVTLKEFVPQSEVFPHVDAVLCHGGSGSVVGALSAGLPLVVTPIGADQPDNARAVNALGAGIAVDTPDAEAMSAALRKVMTDPTYRVAARKVASEIAAQPGIEAAVDEMLNHARSLDDRG
jgi:UDP:flavonoid glycosyltransferase YjiC (YdhE family)